MISAFGTRSIITGVATLYILFGISDISFFSAEGLDIYGNNADKILKDATEKMLVMTFHEKNL